MKKICNRVWMKFQSLLMGVGAKNEIILPKESVPLSQKEFSNAVGVCDYISNLIRIRQVYITEKSLNPLINNPGANWSLENSFFDGYRALISKKYENINLLRVFSQMFSGNYLGIKHAAGLKVPKSIPENLNSEAKEILTNNTDWWRLRYSKLIEVYPSLKGLSLPNGFGETGILVDGVIVNHDTYVYLERVSLLIKYGLIEKLSKKENPVILEIGSGFGALGFLIKKLVPNCTYICVDLPESLIFAAIYLGRYFPNSLLLNEGHNISELKIKDGIFVPNFMFHKLTESTLTLDLAINTLSMSEMTSDQVEYYCQGISSMLKQDGVFFEQNQDNKHVGLIYASDVIKNTFSNRLELSLDDGLTQGSASIWANNENALLGIQRSE